MPILLTHVGVVKMTNRCKQKELVWEGQNSSGYVLFIDYSMDDIRLIGIWHDDYDLHDRYYSWTDAKEAAQEHYNATHFGATGAC